MKARTILVIEDDEANRELMGAVLHASGHNVLEAVDAESGLRVARASRPDLILMDIRLPGMNGLEATRRLKTEQGLGHIPIVAITAFASEEDEQEARAAGCAGYLRKPIDVKSFGASVGAFLTDGDVTPSASP